MKQIYSLTMKNDATKKKEHEHKKENVNTGRRR